MWGRKQPRADLPLSCAEFEGDIARVHRRAETFVFSRVGSGLLSRSRACSSLAGPRTNDQRPKTRLYSIADAERTRSRKTNFWILPVDVLGNGPKTTSLGAL